MKYNSADPLTPGEQIVRVIKPFTYKGVVVGKGEVISDFTSRLLLIMNNQGRTVLLERGIKTFSCNHGREWIEGAKPSCGCSATGEYLEPEHAPPVSRKRELATTTS